MNHANIFVERIKHILLRPGYFFSSIKNETGFKKSFIFYLVLAVLSTFLGIIIEYFFSGYYLGFFFEVMGLPNIPLPQFDVNTIILTSILTLPLVLGLSFAVAGILHLWCKLFKGKADYTKSYQLYVYSRTPDLLFSWIPFVKLFIWIYSLAILIIGTHKVHNVSIKKSTLMFVIPAILVVGIVFVLLSLIYYAFTAQLGQLPAGV